VFAVDQQPVEAGAGQQFGAVAAGQPQPQADLRTPAFSAALNAFCMVFLTQSGS
jgi:hypothetical protein